jgi:hypothetical protein
MIDQPISSQVIQNSKSYPLNQIVVTVYSTPFIIIGWLVGLIASVLQIAWGGLMTGWLIARRMAGYAKRV